ncbi:DNA recombinase [Mycobacterium phage MooMoo]|uniref:RecA-like DNA recombinase n=1 Tax=Mycobacterium phage MooMoo TaxID=2108127 RepID=A0A2P1JR90_9CAUD|nr:DNA recombinase [Mycobacterium phage MooMoo]AVO21668.1 RecA-like DNA recombinase [Mycobacterium phage MooMoo]
MSLKTRPPTCAVPWPLILVEGGEKSGKSWAAAVLSSSEKVGRTLWIDWGEGAADEYGAIPGARYEVIEHDGTWRSILNQVAAARDEAQRAVDAGELPVVLVIDSMTAEWEDLKEWVDEKARRREKNQKLLEKDPDAEIQITPDLWNLANFRHKELMRILMRFPGIVVMTARGSDQMEVENGKPTSKRTWKVAGQKDLAFDASVWVRLSRTEHPQIIGARSVHAGIVPGEDRPKRMPDLTLEKLVFEVLKCDPKTAHVRQLDSAQDRVLDFLDAIDRAGSKDELTAIWRDAKAAEVLNVGVLDGPTVQAAIMARVQALDTAEPEQEAS